MKEDARVISIDEKIPSRLGAHHSLLEEIVLGLEALGWEKQDRFAIHMALEESLTNAIRHGNLQDESKFVLFQCHCDEFEFSATIQDEGSGFQPCEVPDPTLDEYLDVPCGRGLMLIKAYMTLVEYNACGNSIHMVKKREKTADSAETE